MHIVANVPGAAEQPFDAIDEVVYRLVQRHQDTISAGTDETYRWYA